MRLGAAGNSSTANGHAKICTNEKQGAKIPLVKVLKVLRKLFQKFSKQGLGQSPKVFPYHFYPVAGATGNSSTEHGYT